MLLAVLLLSATSAPAAPAPASADRNAALAQYQHDLVSILVLRDDATHLLGAALLARPLEGLPQGADAASLLQRAGSAEGHGPVVDWIKLTDCDGDDTPCPNAQALAALREQAPDNAAVWLLELDRAVRDHDEDAAHHALLQAAAADRYDDYAGAALAAIVAAATALPVPPAVLAAYAGDTGAGAASAQAFLALGVAALHPRPALQSLVALCAPDAEGAEALREPCLKLARTLAWGSSPQARAAGLHIQEQHADGETARNAAQAAQRDLAWQVRNFSRLSLGAMTDQALAVQLLRLAQRGSSETSLMSAMLHRNGIPLEAPAVSMAPAVDGSVAPRPAASTPAADEAADAAMSDTMDEPAPAMSAG